MKKLLCILLLLFGLAPATITSAFASEITEFEYDANNKLVKTISNDTQIKYEYDTFFPIDASPQKQLFPSRCVITTRLIVISLMY
ncbi:hypothetical protein BBG47_24790 [Paenibacillus sp. KS1]|uniref:hypothetical protein n=1 Tax=Paenibacillus sp. KS1 TaxID=1849249 RepID=UPI0008066D73|nr:hypothetical protein [Paenibacillus sp. KS1]OBY76864.1 hypothetical protein BBG47_24790 [Paenibacillus sp. KS1]